MNKFLLYPSHCQLPVTPPLFSVSQLDNLRVFKGMSHITVLATTLPNRHFS